MAIGLKTEELETMIREDVLSINDSRLNQTYQRLVENIAKTITANNDAIEEALRNRYTPR